MDNSKLNTHVIRGEGLPQDWAAEAQLVQCASLDGCRRAVGMPDLHPGPGIPIGACFAFDHLRPALIGSDCGCGARLTFVKAKYRGDALLRRVRDDFRQPFFDSFEEEQLASRCAWRFGIRGLAELSFLPDALRELAAAEPVSVFRSKVDPPEHLAGLATIGAGNHFAEITSVDQIVDRERADSFSIKRGQMAVLVHSGSRSVGKKLAERWGNGRVEKRDSHTYLEEHAGAVSFAKVNRFLISWRLLRALGSARINRVSSSLDLIHNAVFEETVDGTSTWLHRKGCAPAGEGEATVVLGSRGTHSWLMNGLGNEANLFSVAHGAGRRLTRADAKSRFRSKWKRKELERTRIGSTVMCADPSLLYEEHPDAYNPIEPVIRALEDADAATRIASLKPVVTVKQ